LSQLQFSYHFSGEWKSEFSVGRVERPLFGRHFHRQKVLHKFRNVAAILPLRRVSNAADNHLRFIVGEFFKSIIVFIEISIFNLIHPKEELNLRKVNKFVLDLYI